MTNRQILLAIALATLAQTAPAVRKQPTDATKLLDAIIACDAIMDGPQRLECFDKQIAELKAAKQKDVRLFNPGREAEQFKEIISTAISVAEIGDGSWIIVVADQSVWRTTGIVAFEPRRGDAVHIAKAALGGFTMNVGGERAVRVRRLK